MENGAKEMKAKIVKDGGEGDMRVRGEENGGYEDSGIVRDNEVQISSSTSYEDCSPHLVSS